MYLGELGGTPVAAAQADDYGWLRSTGIAYIPIGATGSVTFVAVGEQSHATARAAFKVVVPFGLGEKAQPQATPVAPPAR